MIYIIYMIYTCIYMIYYKGEIVLEPIFWVSSLATHTLFPHTHSKMGIVLLSNYSVMAPFLIHCVQMASCT